MDIAVRNQNYHTATGNHMPYGITQYYLPPGSGDFPAFTSAEGDTYTRFSDPGGMQGWVGCGEGVSPSPLGKGLGRELCRLPKNVVDF